MVASLLASMALVFTACGTPRVIGRIGLAAPFEGRDRALGYDAFPAFRMALRAANGQAGGAVDFVAFNDDGDPGRAARVAADLARDPAVKLVIGHGALTNTLAALPVYAEAGVAVLVIGAPAEALPALPNVFVLSPSAATVAACQAANRHPCAEGAEPASVGAALAGFSEVSGGAAPTRRSVVALDATNVALDALRRAAARGDVSRAGVVVALRETRLKGLLGEIHFNAQGRWVEAPATPVLP
ncbi:MAG: ABC transporter substrate-binding protein [Thermoflexales bacterium]|nr:ABC transporter substrate-binding protein [Thermoflexales bacterium]